MGDALLNCAALFCSLKQYNGPVNKESFSEHRDVTEIILEDNDLDIDAGAFDDLQELLILVIDNSVHKPWNLDSEMFQNNKKLKILYIPHNNIAYLPPEIFAALKLSKVNLSHNFLGNLDPGTFKGNSLRSVDISFNNLQKLRSGVFYLETKKSTLDLSHNNISEIGAGTFAHCRCLQKLIMSHNNLSDLSNPAVFEGATFLEELDISNNLLTDFSTAPFRHLEKLKYVNAAHNPLVTLDPELPAFVGGVSPRLQKINLRNTLLICKSGDGVGDGDVLHAAVVKALEEDVIIWTRCDCDGVGDTRCFSDTVSNSPPSNDSKPNESPPRGIVTTGPPHSAPYPSTHLPQYRSTQKAKNRSTQKVSKSGNSKTNSRTSRRDSKNRRHPEVQRITPPSFVSPDSDRPSVTSYITYNNSDNIYNHYPLSTIGRVQSSVDYNSGTSIYVSLLSIMLTVIFLGFIFKWFLLCFNNRLSRRIQHSLEEGDLLQHV